MLNQNEHGITNEAYCAIQTMSDFIDRLKELQIYDKTLIVLKSDHGMPANYYSMPPNNLRFNEHDVWGYDRYRPLLMIKDRHQKQKDTVFNKETVLLSDLANTLCKASIIKFDCSLYPGANLLSSDIDPNDNQFNIYTTQNSRSSYRYNDLVEINLHRDKDIIEELSTQGVNVSQPPNSPSKNVDELAHQQLEDLTAIKQALSSYYEKYGNYPKSQGWDGLYTHLGQASETWIHGIVPEFIDQLPRDPRENTSPYTQYLYKSNGSDYKLISENGFLAGKVDKRFVDPQRMAHAFGYWTSKARNW